MGAGTKILAGCGCLAIVATAVLVAGLGLGLFWLKDRVPDVTALGGWTTRLDEIEAWEREANAEPWERRVDGVLPEPRLRAFLDIRRRVHDVYDEHLDEIEGLREQFEGRDDPPSAVQVFAAGATAVHLFLELRLAQVQAMAEVGMSEAEYRSIQTSVYVAAGVSRAETETGRVPAEAVSDVARQVQEALRLGLERAREEGVPGASDVSEAELKRLEEALSRAGETGAEVLTATGANVELFRKYEDEIDRYAMDGLALLGL